MILLESIQSRVDLAAPGQIILVPAGDFGPVRIAKPIHLKGDGARFWCDRSSAAVDIAIQGVVIENLALQPIELSAPACVVLRAAPETQPTARHIEVRGEVEGFGWQDGPWLLPELLNLGYVSERNSFFEFDVGVPAACTILTNIDGMRVERSSLQPGINSVRFELVDSSRDSILIGEVRIETTGIIHVIPVYGEIRDFDRATALQRISLFQIADADKEKFARRPAETVQVESVESSLAGSSFGLLQTLASDQITPGPGESTFITQKPPNLRTSDMNRFFVRHGHKEHGPLDAEEVLIRLRQRRFRDNDICWREGACDEQLLEAFIPELVAASVAVTDKDQPRILPLAPPGGVAQPTSSNVSFTIPAHIPPIPLPTVASVVQAVPPAPSGQPAATTSYAQSVQATRKTKLAHASHAIRPWHLVVIVAGIGVLILFALPVKVWERSGRDQSLTQSFTPSTESPAANSTPLPTTSSHLAKIYGVRGRVVQRWERRISIARGSIGGEFATGDDPIEIARDSSTAVYGEPASNDLVNINYKMYQPSAATFSAKTYSLTGRIVDLQPQIVTVETNGVRWEIIREPHTTIGEPLKLDSEITLFFKMLATAMFSTKEAVISSLPPTTPRPNIRVTPPAKSEASSSPSISPLSNAMLGERFPQTRTRFMTATELQNWNATDIQYAINEIYARNGADFQDAETKNTFAKLPWYHPRVRVPLSEIEHSFWAVEADNAKLLGYYRDAMNKRERFLETRTRSMTLEEVRSWSDDKLRYAINEIYARHGAEIENPIVRKQFSSLDWYRPVSGKTYDAAETEFSAVERYNVHLLAEYRKTLARASQPTNRSRSGIVTYPYYSGTVTAVNVQAATIMVINSRGPYIVVITPDTQLSKNGNAIVLQKVAVGDNVRGQARITPDGKGVAKSAIFRSPQR